jgi:integrase
MSDSFSPQMYQGKNVVYVKINGHQGICSIWDWNDQKKKYVKRDTGKRFYAYKRVFGQQLARNFETFDQAKLWRSVGDLTLDDSTNSAMDFREVRKKFFDHVKSKIQVSTFETYESNAKHLLFFDSIPAREITSRTIDAWLVAVKKPAYLELQHQSRISYRHEVSVLRRILTYYSDYEDETYQVPIKERHLEDAIVEVTKYRLAKDRNRTNFIPREDFEKFLQSLENLANEKPKAAICSVMGEFQVGTGARVGEVAAVSWSDVDLKLGTVLISKTVQWSRKKGRPTLISPITKTGCSRQVYLTERAHLILKKWAMKCGRSKGLVFSEDGFIPVPYRMVQHYYDKAFVKAGLKWRSTHILRHTFATDFLEKTGNKLALQGQLGHASSRQTDHYAKITETVVAAGIKAYDKELRGVTVVDMFPTAKTSEKEGLLVAAGTDETVNPLKDKTP